MGANLVGWNVKHLTGPAIAAAHDLGLRVWSYTVNDPARARELVAAGLDGVITDRCDVVREWLA
jgi:glycerophosphoryl diester phosphodiesterase